MIVLITFSYITIFSSKRIYKLSFSKQNDSQSSTSKLSRKLYSVYTRTEGESCRIQQEFPAEQIWDGIALQSDYA